MPEVFQFFYVCSIIAMLIGDSKAGPFMLLGTVIGNMIYCIFC